MRRAPSSRSPQSRLGGSGGATGGSSFRIPFPLLLLLLLPQAPFAKLSRLPLQSPDSFHIERTGVLKFFRAPRDGEVINASAVVLTGRSACRPKEDEVQHKIVLVPSLSLHGYQGCSLDDVYAALDDCGARAAVFMLAPIHNFVAPYWHMSWDRWKFANRRMPLVTVSRSALMRAIDGHVYRGRQDHQRLTKIKNSLTRLADEGNLQLLLAEPWDTTFIDGFESVWWMLIFRVALPSWALFTAATAWVNTLQYHRRRAEWAPGRVVCLIQVPVNTVIAVLLASGLYGPCTLPTYIVACTWMLMAGAGNTTSLLLVLFMREASMAIQKGTRRRNVWKLHRQKLLCYFAVATSIEMAFALPYLGLTPTPQPDDSMSHYVFVIYLLNLLVQLSVRIAYVVQAYQYFRPLKLHLQHPESNPSRRNVEVIQRVVFFVRLSILSMVGYMFFYLLLYYYFTYSDESGLAGYTCIVFGLACSRITISFSQMNAIASKVTFRQPMSNEGGSDSRYIGPAPLIISSLTSEMEKPSEALARLALIARGSGSGSNSLPTEEVSNALPKREEDRQNGGKNKESSESGVGSTSRGSRSNSHRSRSPKSTEKKSTSRSSPLPSIEEGEELPRTAQRFLYGMTATISPRQTPCVLGPSGI